MSILKQSGSHSLSFGEALNLLKDGKMVQRAGWNGKDMFIFMRPEDNIPLDVVVHNVKSLPQGVKDFFAIENQNGRDGSSQIKFTGYLCMKAADGSIVNCWLASQTDMLSNDWSEVVIN